MIVYLDQAAKMAIMDLNRIKTLSAREAKNRFGHLIDIARQEPVFVEKHGRPVVVVISVEDYEQLCSAGSKIKNNKDRD